MSTFYVKPQKLPPEVYYASPYKKKKITINNTEIQKYFAPMVKLKKKILLIYY